MNIERLGGVAATQSETEAASARKREQIAIAAREFEAMFLLQMLKQMRQSMLSEEEAEPGLGASTMSDTIDVELSRHLAGQPGGLSDVIAKALGGSEVFPPKGGSREAAEGGNPEVGERGSSVRAQLLQGRVTSEFGWRSDPLTGAARFHLPFAGSPSGTNTGARASPACENLRSSVSCEPERITRRWRNGSGSSRAYGDAAMRNFAGDAPAVTNS